jgi:hypothetical protein
MHENKIEIFYLMYLLGQMPNMDIKDQNVLDGLLPWSSTLPDRCRIRKTSGEMPAS